MIDRTTHLETSGLPRDHVVSILKRVPIAKSVFDKAMVEAMR
jgi:hypothetical protein